MIETSTQPTNPKTNRPASVWEVGRKFVQEHRPVLGLWFGLRVALFLVPVFAGVFFPYSDGKWTLNPEHPPNPNIWMERLVRSWTHWDGGFYTTIAKDGYISDAHTAFFPLYPHLVRWFSFVFAFGNTNYDALNIAAIIISSLATLGLFVALYQLARLDYDAETSRLTVLYLAIFPVAFYLFAIYTESLFLAIAVGAFLCARKGFWLWAMTLTALAVLCKNQGMVLLAALAIEYLYQAKWDFRQIWQKSLLFFGLPVGALLAWVGYNGVAFGDPLKFIKAQNSFERWFDWPWSTLQLAHRHFFEQKGTNSWLPPGMVQDSIIYDYPLTLLFIALFFISLWVCWKGWIRPAYLVYFGLCLFQPLTSPNKTIVLLGMPRYLLIIFPAFMLLALAGRRWVWLHYLYLAISLPLLGLLLARFALNYWV